MSEFKFFFPIQVRYADLDTQWHVNNIQFCVYMEQARMEYLQQLGLFDGISFHDLGLIVASQQISYLEPIEYHQNIMVGVRVPRFGNKSFPFNYRIVSPDGDRVFATAETVMVSYDYRQKKSRLIPEEWRSTIASYENIPAFG